jgi:hypothetical protein
MINIILKKPTLTRSWNEDSFQEIYKKIVYKKIVYKMSLEEEESSKKKKNQEELQCYYLTVTTPRATSYKNDRPHQQRQSQSR